jgi:hypothetical protein
MLKDALSRYGTLFSRYANNFLAKVDEALQGVLTRPKKITFESFVSR